MFLILIPTLAAAREKAGILILPGTGVMRELTEDMTEVLSIELSKRYDFFFVMTLKEQVLARYQKEYRSDSDICTRDISCLREAGRFLSLDIMVVGTISKDGRTFKIELTQVSMTDHPDRFWAYTAVDTTMLVACVQNASTDILSPQGTFVMVKTDILDADVVLDDELKGQTPIKPISIKAGKHKLKISKKNYDDFFIEFDCQREQVCKVEAPLRQVIPSLPPVVITSLPTPMEPPIVEQTPSLLEKDVSLQRILAYSTAGIAIVSGGLGGYFLWDAKDIENYLNDNCFDPNGKGVKQCSYTEQTMRDKVSEGKDSVMLANVCFGVAGVAAVSSVLLFALEPDNADNGLATFLAPLVSSDGTGFVGTVRF